MCIKIRLRAKKFNENYVSRTQNYDIKIKRIDDIKIDVDVYIVKIQFWIIQTKFLFIIIQVSKIFDANFCQKNWKY